MSTRNSQPEDTKTVRADQVDSAATDEPEDEQAARVRTSEERRQKLQTFVQTIANASIHVDLKPDLPTAHVSTVGEPYQMAITSREVEQTQTEYPQLHFDYLVQYGFATHEVGHVLWTDGEALQEALTEADIKFPGLASKFHNLCEDGYLEWRLRGIGTERVKIFLDLLRLTFFGGDIDDGVPLGIDEHGNTTTLEDSDVDLSDSIGDEEDGLTALGAIHLAVQDLFVWDSGEHDVLRDPNDDRLEFASDEHRNAFESIYPTIETRKEEILNNHDHQERPGQIVEFWKEIEDHLEDHDMFPDVPDNQIIIPGGMLDDDSQGGSSSPAQGSNIQPPQAPPESGDDSGGKPGEGSEQGESGDEESSEPADGEGESGGEESDANEMGGGGGNSDEQTPELDSDKSGQITFDDFAESDEDSGESGAQAGADEEDGTAGDSADGDNPEDGEDQQPGEGGEPAEDGAEEDEGGMGGDESEGDEDESEGDSEGAEESNGDQTGNDQSDSPDEGSDDTTPMTLGQEDINTDRLKEAAQKLAEQETRSQVENLDQNVADAKEEAEKLQDAMGSDDSGTGGIEDITIKIDQTNGIRNQDKDSAIADSSRLASVLEEQLKREQRNDTRKNLRSGHPNEDKLWKAGVGDSTIFNQTRPGGDKDYSVGIVLDRSGSMGHDEIDAATKAVFRIALSLEKVGIETQVMDMFNSNLRIVSPYHQDTMNSGNAIYETETGGGTPLSEVLAVGRKRAQQASRQPFLIVVTDGRPNDEESYLKLLKQTRMPIIGVVLAGNKNSVDDRLRQQEQYYHACEFILDNDNLYNRLTSLMKSLII